MVITLDTLMERRSVRSYSGQPLTADHHTLLARVMAEQAGRCPFGSRPRFSLTGPGLVQPPLAGPEQPSSGDLAGGGTSARIGTYGIIRNPPAFIVGAVAAGPNAVMDYGYALEGIILAATAAGLGTCWLGGTFNRTAARDILGLKAGELIPAITPVGLPAERRSLTDRALRFFAGSDSRKPWDTLFFNGKVGKPLDKASAGVWTPVLEAVRMGPSASNKQPWRIIREDTSRFSLLFAEDKAYNGALGIPIQELDLGIAMKHFELAAAACGLQGRWTRDPARGREPKGGAGGSLAYIASWEL